MLRPFIVSVRIMIISLYIYIYIYIYIYTLQYKIETIKFILKELFDKYINKAYFSM